MKTIDKRRQKRMDKKENEKDLISLWKKKMKLMQGKRALNWVELSKPERWGYKRFFVLREDVAKSREAEFLKGILKLVQNTVFSRDKKFEYKDYKTKKKLPIEQSVGFIAHKDWNKLIAENKLTEKQKNCFEVRWRFNKGGKSGYWVYVLIKDYMFVTKVQLHYVTHRLIINPQLESELKELSNRIETQGLWPKISKVFGWSNGCKDYIDAKKKLIENATDKMMTDGVDEFVDRYTEYDSDDDY
jgi:hypothetical protein